MRKSAEEKILPTLTVRAFVTGLVFSLLVIVVGTLTYYWGNTYTIMIVKPIYTPAFWTAIYIPMTLLALAPTFLTACIPKKLRFSGAELALIYSMINISLFTTYSVGVPLFFFRGIPSWSSTMTNSILQNASPVLAPKDVDVLENMITGGVPVPWSEWTTPLLYWMFSTITFAFYFLFLADLLRRQYVEIESLAFPLAKYPTTLIEMTKSRDGRTGFFRDYLFYVSVFIAFIIGFLQTSPMIKGGAFTGGLTINTTTFQQTQKIFLMKGWRIFPNWSPWLIGFCLLLPTDVLATFLVSHVIFQIVIPQILFQQRTINLFQAILEGWYASTPAEIPRWGNSGLFLGLLVGIAFYPVFMQRKAFIRSIRNFISGAPAEEGVLSDRVIWAGTILFGLLWLASLVTMGLPIEWSLYTLLFVSILNTAASRVRAETGGTYGGMSHGSLESRQLWAWPAIDGGLANNPTGTIAFIGVGHSYGTLSSGSGLYGIGSMQVMENALENYNVGKLTKARPKDLFIGQLTAILLSAIIVLPLTLWVAYTYGLQFGGPEPIYPVMDSYNVYNTKSFAIPKPNDFVYYTFGAGIALTIALYVLRGIFPWLFLTPSGFLLGITNGAIHLFFPAIIALVVKYIIIRIGGVGLFERRVMPVAIGLMAGYGLSYGLCALLTVLINLGYL